MLSFLPALSLIALQEQAVKAADDCRAILDAATQQELHYKDVSQFRMDLRKSLNLTEEELQQQKASGALSAPIADYLLKVGDDSDEVRSFKRLLQIDNRLAMESLQGREIHARIISPSAYENWRRCMERAKADVVLDVEGASVADPNGSFVVSLSYMPKSAVHAKEIKVIQFGLVNAEGRGEGPLESGAILKEFSGLSRICRRSSEGDVVIAVDLEGYPTIRHLLPRIAPRPSVTTEEISSWTSGKFVPPHTRGDDEFGLSPGNFPEQKNLGIFRCRAHVKTNTDRSKLFVQLFMHGEEQVHDHTTVDGSTSANGDEDQFVIFRAPAGWKIKEVVRPKEETYDELEFLQNDEKHGELAKHGNNDYFLFEGDRPRVGGELIEGGGFKLSKNGLVKVWTVWGDTSARHVAGKITGMKVTTEPIVITLEKP